MRTHIAAVALGRHARRRTHRDGCSRTDPNEPNINPTQHHGDLVSTTHLGHLSRRQVVDYLHDHGLDPAAARHSVDLYRVVYRTAGVTTRSTTASALIALPAPMDGRCGLWPGCTAPGPSAVTWLPCKTISIGAPRCSSPPPLRRRRAGLPWPRRRARSPPLHDHQTDGLCLHSMPFTPPGARRTQRETAGPRRPGLRILPGRASDDADRSGPAAGRGRLLPGEPPWRRSPGRSDVRGQEVPAALDGRLEGRTAAFYLSYAMISWNRTYPIYTSPAEVCGAPYDRLVEDLFDGTHTEEEIFTALPDSPAQLFAPDPSSARLPSRPEPCVRPSPPTTTPAPAGDRTRPGLPAVCRDAAQRRRGLRKTPKAANAPSRPTAVPPD